jgi:hypothetical protein
MIREALINAGRQDLIGSGCDSVIPAIPPKEALVARRQQANEAGQGDHFHSVANPFRGEPTGERRLPNYGYRPGRKSARCQNKQRKQKGNLSTRPQPVHE